MFTPRAFAETDLLWLDRLLARDPFVAVLTPGSDGLPELTRMPVLYRRDGDQIELRGHWARANPQSRHRGAAKVLVDGPHGYVSASWYPDKEPAARVPWNYAAAELRGQLRPSTIPCAGRAGRRDQRPLRSQRRPGLAVRCQRVPNMARSCAPSSASASRSNTCS
jgi:hypothetical protein